MELTSPLGLVTTRPFAGRQPERTVGLAWRAEAPTERAIAAFGLTVAEALDAAGAAGRRALRPGPSAGRAPTRVCALLRAARTRTVGR